MLYFVLFSLEIIIIFFLSKRVQRVLSSSLMRMTKNKTMSVYIMSFLFLPGTFVHEISHFLMALFLLVPVGNLNLIPVIEGDGVRLGSVSIAKTDPIRRFLIGAAPLIVGVGIIVSIFFFLPINKLINDWFLLIVVIYGVFTISNTMFSSKKDMEGLWAFLFVIVFLIVLMWVIGIRLDFSGFLQKTEEIFKTSSLFLSVPLLIDLLFLKFSRWKND